MMGSDTTSASEHPAPEPEGVSDGSGQESAELVGLLEFIRDSRGFDFTGYKHTSLTRRIRKRMSDVGVADYRAYADLLETNAEEFQHLFNTILINVTSFFRDPETWAYLESDPLPELLAARTGEEIRVWSAGCSTGEEAYSLAMVFAELLGVAEAARRVKIYATDVDADALRTARAGVYTAKAIEPIAARLREKYFQPSPADGDQFVFRPDLRKRVIFGRHDLTRDAPISRLDVLVCRNTLMYFNAETQHQIIDRFHFACRDSGVVVLGKAEMLLASEGLFEAVNVRQRVFRRVGERPTGAPRLPAPTKIDIAGDGLRKRLYRDMVLDVTPNAIVGVDLDQNVSLINNQARALFGLSARDIGRPLRDLDISSHPLQLRSHVEQANAEARAVRIPAVERRLGSGDAQYLDILIAPLRGTDGVAAGFAVVFTDATHTVRLGHEVKRGREDLETAYEELQSTNEELETTNEELQSSIEELETTNEELQSTNEELETTNEELQSSNEELETMNDEMRLRSADLEDTRGFLQGVLTSVETAVVVLDTHTRVISWNRAAETLWGLHASLTRAQPLFALELGLPEADLRESIEHTQTTGRSSPPIHVEVATPAGRRFTCKIACTALDGRGTGVVLMMEEVLT